MKDWMISEAEKFTEAEASEMAVEKMVVKGHNIYFMDMGETFGYSCLVFKDGHHIHYANDYQLHHRNINTVDELRQFYISELNNILFTEEEIIGPVKDYDEFYYKERFLRNYYNMRTDYISVFYSGSKEEFKKKTEKTF